MPAGQADLRHCGDVELRSAFATRLRLPLLFLEHTRHPRTSSLLRASTAYLFLSRLQFSARVGIFLESRAGAGTIPHTFMGRIRPESPPQTIVVLHDRWFLGYGKHMDQTMICDLYIDVYIKEKCP